MDERTTRGGRAVGWGVAVTLTAWVAGTAVWLATGGTWLAIWGPDGPDRTSLTLLVVSALTTSAVAWWRARTAARLELALLGTAAFVASVVVVQTVHAWEAGPLTALSIGLDGLVWAFVNGGALVAFVVGFFAAPWVRWPHLPSDAGADRAAGRTAS